MTMAMVNPYVREFIAEYNERFSIDSKSMTTSQWICRNTQLHGKQFSLKGYEFQQKIADDLSPEMDVIKISQVGLTEIQLRKVLSFVKRNRGTNAIFTLSDENMMERISTSRLKLIVDDNKVFNSKYDIEKKVTRTKEIWQFDQSFVYLAAALESAATSINADMVLNDEVDLSDQSMIALFSSRMQGSKHKIHQRFSTPSFPNFGIDAGYSASDQHIYVCRCAACGHWNDPQFDTRFVKGLKLPGNIEKLTDMTQVLLQDIDLDQLYVGCEKCDARLDLADPSIREWVPMFPGRRFSRGYRVSVFSTANLSIRYIFTQMLKYQDKQYLRGFFNTVLGQAYSDDTIQLSEEAIRSCFTEQAAPPQSLTSTDAWLGIDIGTVCHITVGVGPNANDIVEILQVNKLDLVKTVKELMKRYRVRAGAVDRFPESVLAHEVMLASKGRILPVEYRGTKELNIVRNKLEEVTHAQTDRTWFLDQVVGKIKKKELTISGFSYRKEVFVQHLRAMARNEEPEKAAVWIKLTNNDHFFHAAAFMTLAPYIAELLKFESNADQRTMILGIQADMSKSAAILPGVSKKRVDAFHSKG